MNNQPMKRRNPFASPRVQQQEQEIQEVIQAVEPQIEEVEQVIQQPVRQEPVYKPTTRRTQPKQVKVRREEPLDESREKYTSTMDTNLRREIKIICATRGIMFSQFIEDACKEKIDREGGR